MKPETWIRVHYHPFTQTQTPFGPSAGHYGCILPNPSNLKAMENSRYVSVYWRDRHIPHAPIHPDLGLPFTMIPVKYLTRTNPPINQLLWERTHDATAA